MLLLLSPAAIHLIQPLNTIVESWYHYGFNWEIELGPIQVEIAYLAPARELVEEIIEEVTGISSPLGNATLEAIAAYQPSHGQSFGPDTGNMRDYGPHGGVDLDSRVGGGVGEPVLSPISGEVIAVSDLCGDGSSFQIRVRGKDHQGYVTHRLNHIDNVSVVNGQKVKAGEQIAAIAPTDCESTGPHLDWKIDNGQGWVNPQTYVQQYLDKREKGTPALSAPIDKSNFELTDEQLKRGIGAAEGTLTPEGDRTSAFNGHVDPGNGAWNLGTFSYQHGANSPEEADAKQLERLRKQAAELQRQAKEKGIDLTFGEAINGADLANQAPAAALEIGGYVDRLVEAKEMGLKGWEAIHWARVWSFIDPATGTWNAPGLGNNKQSIEADQLRRLKAIEAAMEAINE